LIFKNAGIVCDANKVNDLQIKCCFDSKTSSSKLDYWQLGSHLN